MSTTSPQPAEKAHRFVKLLQERLKASGRSRAELEREVGFASGVMFDWWHGKSAILLQNMEAALEAVGYRLIAVSIPSRATEHAFKVGDCYQMRQGGFARIESATDQCLRGRMLKSDIPLTWNLGGQRIPVAGDDPSDLVPPP